MGVHALLVLATFGDYGITYDETWYLTYGYHVLRWYLSGFSDTSAMTYWTLPYEAGFVQVLVRVANLLLPTDLYQTAHLLGGLIGVAGTYFTWRLASHLGGPRCGFVAALIVVTIPRWYGDTFANPRDVPMAVLALATLDGIVRILDHLPRPPLRRTLAVALPMGLSLAVRFGSLFLAGYVGLAFLAWLVWSRAQGRGGRLSSDLLAGLRTYATILVVAWACMLPFWPKAIVQPLWPIEGFLYTTQHFAYDIRVLFEGRTLSNQDLPWYYVPKWLALVLPEHVLAGLALAALGAVLWLRARIRSRGRDLTTTDIGVGLVAVAACLPPAYAVLHGVIDYDGIRHFLFVLPPMAVLCALGLEAALARLRSPSARAVLALGMAAPAVLAVADMLRLHPYQYIHFNRLVAGGLPGAHGRYETEYWGASYKEGVEWIAASYHRPELGRRIRVASNSYSTSTSWFLPEDRFEYVGSFGNGQRIEPGVRPDLYLTILRWNGLEKCPGKIVHSVTRMGVPLLHVVEVQP